MPGGLLRMLSSVLAGCSGALTALTLYDAVLSKAQPGTATALVTTFSLFEERAVFVVASWAPQTVRVTLTIDWRGLGLAPGAGLKVTAPAVEGWQNAMDLGNGTAAPSFELPPKGGLIIVACKA